MRRKLVQHGNTSLTVSIPKKWTDKFHLKKGDEIEIDEQGDSIILKADKGGIKPIKKGILDISILGSLSRRAFDAMYKAGYDEVEINYTNNSQLVDIEKAINLEAMTFEIVKQEKNKCIVKNISEADTKEFDQLLRRTVLLLKVMSDDILTALKNRDYDTIRNIKDLERTNNKFTHFCRRALAKNSYKEYDKTVFLYTFVEQLESCADELKFLCNFLIENSDMRIDREIISLFEDVNKATSLFTELFNKFDIQKAKKLSSLRKRVIKDAFELFNKKRDRQKIIIHHLINIENRVFDLLGPYLATVL